MRFPVLTAVAGGLWREQRARLALAALGIALGVALGVAVHVINESASNEFDVAVRSLAGEADLIVRGPRSGFPDALYARIAKLPGVRTASPSVELEAQVSGTRESLRILGLDPFRAYNVQRALMPEGREAVNELLKSGTVILSQPAAANLKVQTGDVIRLHAGSGIENFRVVAVLPAGATRRALAIMDVANAQWQFGRVGVLHRVDVKLQPGTDLAAFNERLEHVLPAGVVAGTPDADAARNENVSRAYRLNLDMLALVALFTGAFLVFSTQFLALLRRRTNLAVVRVLGLTRGALLRLLLIEGALVGVLGSAVGLVLGCALAWFGLKRLGGDLGAGYFRGIEPALHVDPVALAVFFVLGVVFALLGVALPAREASRREPALALKAGDEEEALRSFRGIVPALIFLLAGAMTSQLPPIAGLPVAGYVSVALILIGAILVMPRFAEALLSRLPLVRYPPAALAAAQLQATPRQVGVSLAAILASFSLMVAMVVMVGSFRDSLAAWLDQMLPADLYVRAGRVGDSGYFTREEQARLERVPGVRQVIFIRSQNAFMRPDLPPVTLLVRSLAVERVRETLPIIGGDIRPDAGQPPPVWVSEIATDLLQLKVGAPIQVPIGNARHTFTVAGMWRDYARQNGAIVIERETYIALTGDDRANDAAVFLESGLTFDEGASRIREALADAPGMELAPTREIKTASLAVFDRTFAITYALELAAVVIGLFGVSTSFSAQALARRREFGVLRHLGMTRRQVAAMLGWEGFAVGALGMAAGFATGWVVSLVLVHVINRQSFHWSIDMHVPWGTLAVLAAVIVALASVTAILSGRRAMGHDVVRAVREDW